MMGRWRRPAVVITVLVAVGSTTLGLLAARTGPASVTVGPAAGVLAFHADPDGRDDLYLLDIKARRSRPLTIGLEQIASAEWSPDGTKLAFTARPRGIAQVFVVHSDGSSLRELTHSAADSRGVEWSPNSNQLAFSCCGESQHQIRVVNPDGGRARVLVANGDHPVWSPDGSRLAFL